MSSSIGWWISPVELIVLLKAEKGFPAPSPEGDTQ